MSDNRERARALPIWSMDVDPQPLAGGLSNENFTVEDGSSKYVVRFGDDFAVHHVFRDNERMAATAAHAAGFAPELVHAEQGVMVCRYVESTTYDERGVQENIDRIADLVKRYHISMPQFVSGPGRIFWPFHVVRDYAKTLRDGKSRMIDEVPGYVDLANELEAVQPPLPIIYGHHDLLPANFLDDGQRLWLIDFEYAAFSTPMFDLAGIASNALFEPEQDEALLAAYFGAAPGPELVRGHAAMKCASLLREAMWSMVSEIHLDTPGIDYVEYTRENLERLSAALDSYRSRFQG